MSNVTKKDIVREVAKSLGVTDEHSVLVVVQGFIDQIMENLAQGKRMEFREFGVFEVKARKAKKGRNIKKGTSVEIPASLVVKFSPGSELCKKMDELKTKTPNFLEEYK